MSSNFAVFGDIHGNQDRMYEVAMNWENTTGKSIDAVVQLGDFETIRDENDFSSYYAPKKYRHISDFADYYSGKKKAPYFTVFISGNHEAWNVLSNHPKGGFVAPNMYYLGRSGMIDVKGVRIAGLSGIYSQEKYGFPLSSKPHRDWKYYRKSEVELLKGTNPDILLLHEWVRPLSLLDIIESSDIPSNLNDGHATPATNIAVKEKPSYVFMAHMHRYYLKAKMGDTRVFGLAQLSGVSIDKSFEVITL